MRRKISDEERTILKLSCLVYDRLGEHADCSGLIEAFDVAGNGLPNDRAPLCRCHAREAGEAGSVERERFETTNWIDLREAADRIAVMHSPPNGIRGLADRFAAEQMRARVEQVIGRTSMPGRLSDRERADLLGWVGREMNRDTDGSFVVCGSPSAATMAALGDMARSAYKIMRVAQTLGVDHQSAMALCDAARGSKSVTHEWKRVRCVLQSAALAWSRELVEAGWETVAMRDAKLDGSPVPGWQVLASRPIGGAP